MPDRHGERQEMPLVGAFECLERCFYGIREPNQSEDSVSMDLDQWVVHFACNLHPGPVLQLDLHLLLVNLHVVDVEGDVLRGLADVNVDEDFSVNGEIIRDEEGNEIEFIPYNWKDFEKLNLEISYLDGLMLAGSLTSISSSVTRQREGERAREMKNINSMAYVQSRSKQL